MKSKLEQDVVLRFEQGSLLIDAQCWSPKVDELIGPWFQFDERTGEYRALAHHYRDIVLKLHREPHPYLDRAKGFENHNFAWEDQRTARQHQSDALAAWKAHHKRGTVVLPTGAGKTFVALMAMHQTQRPALVITPTLDLVAQWSREVESALGFIPGIWGGGEHETANITISTYDSAQIHMEHHGHRFGLLIFDECHHLPGPSYQWIAKMAIAPFRLGLSATPERNDGEHRLLDELIGPMVHRSEVSSMRGSVLSDYSTEIIEIPLDEAEHLEYQRERKLYVEYLKANAIDFSSPQGWNRFVQSCAKSEDGRRAMAAYRRQKQILRESDSKLRRLWGLLWEHRQSRIIIFTNDNETAYSIGERFTLPVLTHQTTVKERALFLRGLKDGSLPYLVTSRVLNEGVDVPEVDVGIVVSGTGSVREHVQRLGRILRKREGKTATLLELISADTSESRQSQRRREHEAYR